MKKARKLLIIHQFVPDGALPDESDVITQAEEIAAAAKANGDMPELLAIKDTASVDEIAKKEPDIVFNLVETFEGTAAKAHIIPDMLEKAGFRFTGNSAKAIELTTDKVKTKEILAGNGIATPEWQTKDSGKSFMAGKYIFKPVSEDASLGITEENLRSVPDKKTADELISCFEKKYGIPFFCEKYIEGREFNVSLIKKDGELLVMKPAEMVFGTAFGKDKFLSYESKWNEDSAKYKLSRRSFSLADKDTNLLNLLKKINSKCWNVLGLSGYVRVDFRVDKEGMPFVLEVNANPCLAHDAGFFAAMENSGFDYSQMIKIIVDEAEK